MTASGAREQDANRCRWPWLAWCRTCEVGTLERRCWCCGASLGPPWLDALAIVSGGRVS